MQVHNVIWQEGMLLRPQHLQHNDRYYQQQLNRSRLLTPDAWGFLSLELDLQYLNLGKLVVSQARGVLPDGSLFELDGAMPPLVLQVAANSGPQGVYLALPLATGNQVETRRPEQVDVLARYVSCEVQARDANAGGESECRLDCARPDLRLVAGAQSADPSLVTLKVAEIVGCTSEGGVSLDTDFTPTFIHLPARGYLAACLQEVISLLASRGDALAERIRGNGAAAATQVGDFLLLQLINRTEPVLRHYASQPQVRPHTLYRELLALLGELSSFACDSKRCEWDVHYQHSDQGASFRGLMDGLRSVLSMVLEQQAIELELQQRQYGVLVCPVSDLKLLGRATFILAATAGCDSEALRNRLPTHLKVGPVERIRELVNLHLAGIRLQPLPVAPRQLPFHAGKTYFMLELTARDIAQLEHSGGFAFHVSGEFAELQLNFWAIRN
ncbi:type VI secretion system baseplate subunit TssK [Pseudomonas sp. PDM05]|jgi:type VI secretion system protein ImpJ|uniref:type VI secretion system baseplate subunit TssK n=1 Tax=unclassified Pseudomonas TaxID=196821 RepID=UPI0017854E44|nr:MULTISPECIES: type VI secretion system baseplate subunit TssK [unclassified Pseudomonas]MBD9460953.1 type VI secretion system baseplate subunit TssK [Pseudomonas sp. PDM05]